MPNNTHQHTHALGARRRGLALRTYAVLPLTDDCGILQWVNHLVRPERCAPAQRSLANRHGCRSASARAWLCRASGEPRRSMPAAQLVRTRWQQRCRRTGAHSPHARGAVGTRVRAAQVPFKAACEEIYTKEKLYHRGKTPQSIKNIYESWARECLLGCAGALQVLQVHAWLLGGGRGVWHCCMRMRASVAPCALALAPLLDVMHRTHTHTPPRTPRHTHMHTCTTHTLPHHRAQPQRLPGAGAAEPAAAHEQVAAGALQRPRCGSG
jgi:hypothetical protein